MSFLQNSLEIFHFIFCHDRFEKICSGVGGFLNSFLVIRDLLAPEAHMPGLGQAEAVNQELHLGLPYTGKDQMSC